MSLLIGDKNGIALFNKMSNTRNNDEAEYFKRVNESAQKHGTVFFTDCVLQRELGRNQAQYQMTWNGQNWVVSLFILPDGAKIVNYDSVPSEVNLEDIILEG